MLNDHVPSKSSPSFPTRVFHYTRALSRWIKAGRPARNEEEILGIFVVHCQQCDSMDHNHSCCIVCGCHVGTVKSPLSNKIAMATEHCPLDKW